MKLSHNKNSNPSTPIIKQIAPLLIEEMTPHQRTLMVMQNTEKKVFDEMDTINHQIYQAKIPFLNYYHDETEILKSNKEIRKEMKNRFKFFNDFPLDSKLGRYRVKDFYIEKKPVLNGNFMRY